MYFKAVFVTSGDAPQVVCVLKRNGNVMAKKIVLITKMKCLQCAHHVLKGSIDATTQTHVYQQNKDVMVFHTVDTKMMKTVAVSAGILNHTSVVDIINVII